MAQPEVTDDAFEQDVLGSDHPVVVDFWDPRCRPCRLVNPIIEALAEQYGDRVSFLKMNVDENPETASRYNILSIPTVTLFEAGAPQETIVGARPKSHYEGAWERWLRAVA